MTDVKKPEPPPNQRLNDYWRPSPTQTRIIAILMRLAYLATLFGVAFASHG